MTWDLTTTVNLILCIIIVVFAIIGYQRSGKSLALYVGIAFGLFGLSHLSSILGWTDALGWVLILIRTAAYLLVAFALYSVAFVPKIER